jgi:predicted Ser/Thr protein kinase
MDIIIAGRYKLVKKLGSSKNPAITIYQGQSCKSTEQVAIKMERLKTKRPHLQYEYHIYKHLEGGASQSMIPRVIHFGQEGDFNILIMENLGPNLNALFQFCDMKF